MKNIIKFLVIFLMLNSSIAAFATYDEALQLFKQNKYKQSLKKVAEILIISDDLKPESPNYKLRYLASQNHMKLGNSKSAIIHLQKCMGIEMNSVNPYIDIALYQIELKKYNEAKKNAIDGLKIGEDSMLYYILGKVALVRREYNKAKEFFEKANSLDSENYVSYNDLGITLMKIKKYNEANTAFSIASMLAPNSSQILNNLGKSYEKLKKYSKAKEFYKKAKKINKNSKIINRNLEKISKR